jgi:hypothetical protein
VSLLWTIASVPITATLYFIPATRLGKSAGSAGSAYRTTTLYFRNVLFTKPADTDVSTYATTLYFRNVLFMKPIDTDVSTYGTLKGPDWSHNSTPFSLMDFHVINIGAETTETGRLEGQEALSWTNTEESTLLRMRRVQRMSFREIAGALDRSEESVACKYLKLVPLRKRMRSTNRLMGGAQAFNSRLKEG